MPAGEGQIDAPMEAGFAPLRSYVAGVAQAQEGALALALAAAELGRSAATLYAQQFQLCLGWSTVAARMLEHPRHSGGLDASSAVVSLLREQAARVFGALLQVTDRFENDPRWTRLAPAAKLAEPVDERPVAIPE